MRLQIGTATVEGSLVLNPWQPFELGNEFSAEKASWRMPLTEENLSIVISLASALFLKF